MRGAEKMPSWMIAPDGAGAYRGEGMVLRTGVLVDGDHCVLPSRHLDLAVLTPNSRYMRHEPVAAVNSRTAPMTAKDDAEWLSGREAKA